MGTDFGCQWEGEIDVFIKEHYEGTLYDRLFGIFTEVEDI